MRMRVTVDPAKCQGHTRCVALAPDIFEVDDLGTASAIGDGEVPTEMEALAKLAADNCPEFAIAVTDG